MKEGGAPMADEIRGIQAGYTGGIYTPDRIKTGDGKQGQEARETPQDPGERYEPGDHADAGIYSPKMFRAGQNGNVKENQGVEETQKTGGVSLKQAQEEFFEVLKDAKENHGAKPILIEHFDKIKSANSDQGNGNKAGAAGEKGGAAQKAGGPPPHVQVAASLMNESRFPPELQAKFQEKGNQLMQAWERESQGSPSGEGTAENKPLVAAGQDAKKAE